MTRIRLHKSKTEHLIFGVCGGLAEYFNIDPVLVRLAFVLLVFASGVGILAYIILAIIMPKEETVATKQTDIVRENLQSIRQDTVEVTQQIKDTVSGTSSSPQESAPQAKTAAPSHEERRRSSLALILIVVGIVLFLANLGLFWWLEWGKYWPLLLVLLGIAIIAIRSRRSI